MRSISQVIGEIAVKTTLRCDQIHTICKELIMSVLVKMWETEYRHALQYFGEQFDTNTSENADTALQPHSYTQIPGQFPVHAHQEGNMWMSQQRLL